MKLSFVLLAAFFCFSAAALAQNTTTTLPVADGDSTSKISELLKNKKFQEEEAVTDAKLKADAGSLSKYSLKFNLSYYGPNLADISAKDQPNPDNSIGPRETSIGGSLGGRYRIDSTKSITAGTGVKAIHPFHGMERFDTSTPYLGYDQLSRVGDIQMRNSPGVSLVTLPAYTRVGEYAGVSYDVAAVYNIGTSGYALGLSASLGYYFFNRGYDSTPSYKDKNGNLAGGDGKATRYNLSLSPSLKYNFTDKFNLNTSVGIGLWNPRSLDNQYALLNNLVTQSIGLGYAITRDVYVSPYVSFYPDKLSTDRATFNVSSSFSVL